MNARQKAKHFKKLYEQVRPNYKIIKFPSNNLKHYTAGRVVMPDDLCDFPEDVFFKCVVCPELIEKFKTKMIENIGVETEGQRKIYRLDVWMKE